jgi:hypothetical protein
MGKFSGLTYFVCEKPKRMKRIFCEWKIALTIVCVKYIFITIIYFILKHCSVVRIDLLIIIKAVMFIEVGSKWNLFLEDLETYNTVCASYLGYVNISNQLSNFKFFRVDKFPV